MNRTRYASAQRPQSRMDDERAEAGGSIALSWAKRRHRIVMALLCAAATQSSPAQEALLPDAAFVQAGTGGDTHAVTAGLMWDWNRRWSLAGGQLDGYWEVSLSGWSYPAMDGRRSAWLGQLGAVPTFRYRPDRSAWFGEIGIGLSFTTTVYETQRKQFSTSFNFADHIGIGRSFGRDREHELMLRIEHFSNAGIKHPNPGENFVELRYAYRFR
jgi:lipid A 3-O-deacylase